MAAIDDHEVDVLVLWKWSRLARRRLDFEVALDRVRGVGGEVESATEPVDTKTAAGRFQRGVLAEVAAFEAERIGEGWEETHARRRAAGLPAQGGRRYGYRRVQVEGRREQAYAIDEDEADVLRWAYARVIDGRGASFIAAELNRQGVPNPVGNRWRQQKVYPLLDSGFAAGLLIHEPRDSEGRKGSERHYHEGAHPAIITRDAWEAYLLARRARSSPNALAVEPKYPLSGLLRCGDCGAGMWITAGGVGAGHSYACAEWSATKSVRCVTVVRRRAEAAVLEWIRQYARDVERAADADRALTARLGQAKRAAETAARRAQVAEERLARLTAMRARDEVSAVGYDEARRDLEAEAQAAREEVEVAELESARRPPAAREVAAGLVDEWDELPATERRNLLATMIRSVTVDPPAVRGGRSTITVVPLWSE